MTFILIVFLLISLIISFKVGVKYNAAIKQIEQLNRDLEQLEDENFRLLVEIKQLKNNYDNREGCVF